MRRLATALLHRLSPLTVAVTMVMGLSCSGGDGELVGDDPSFEEFLDGKLDTGYVGSRAAEIDATLTARVAQDVSTMNEAQREELRASAERNPRVFLESRIASQIQFARNPLRQLAFNINLEGGAPRVSQVVLEGDRLVATYSVEVESLVKFSDLEARGVTIDSLVGRTFDIILPAEPDTIAARGGAACASDFDADRAAVDPHELTVESYFYYFDPERDGCTLDRARDVETARFEVRSSLDAPTVYPEYDMLIADGVIRMVALFGQLGHGELASNDEGWLAYRAWLGYLEWNFELVRVEDFPNDFGSRWEATWPSGLRVEMDVYSPAALDDRRPAVETQTLFREALGSHEIFYYNGHSFYGALDMLEFPEFYPERTYQIVQMDSCWSYNYYTRQVFEAKATESDPDGTRYADVVNNVEPARAGSHNTAYNLYLTIMTACDALMSGRPPVDQSWNALVEYMNRSAEWRTRSSGGKPEVYGVSGVRNNVYLPTRPRREPVTFDSNAPVEIPDADPEGVASSIEVTGPSHAGEVRVTVDIAHSNPVDLSVVLVRSGREVTLFSRSETPEDALHLEMATREFSGLPAAGEWRLIVSDNAPSETGTLVSWSLAVVPAL